MIEVRGLTWQRSIAGQSFVKFLIVWGDEPNISESPNTIHD